MADGFSDDEVFFLWLMEKMVASGSRSKPWSSDE